MSMTQFEKSVIKELHEISKELHQLNSNTSRNKRLEMSPVIDIDGVAKILANRLAEEEMR